MTSVVGKIDPVTGIDPCGYAYPGLSSPNKTTHVANLEAEVTRLVNELLIVIEQRDRARLALKRIIDEL